MSNRKRQIRENYLIQQGIKKRGQKLDPSVKGLALGLIKLAAYGILFLVIGSFALLIISIVGPFFLKGIFG